MTAEHSDKLVLMVPTARKHPIERSAIFAIAIVAVLFGMGVFTYSLALFNEADLQAPYYVKLATWGAMLSITATFLAVFYSCFKDLAK